MTYLSDTDQAGIEATVFDFLGQTCTVERPQYVDDGMGQRERSWVAVATGVPMKMVQRAIGLQLEDTWLRPTMVTTVTVPKTTDIRLGDHLRLPDDSVWLVQSTPIPRELTLVLDVKLVSVVGADDPVGLAASAAVGEQVTFQPSGTIAATNVQDAIEELDAASTKFERGTVVTDPDGIGALDVVVWRAPYACMVEATRGFRIGGTGCIVRARKGIQALNVSDLSLVNANQWYIGQDIQNGSFAAGDALVLEVVQVSGTVTEVTIQVDFRRE